MQRMRNGGSDQFECGARREGEGVAGIKIGLVMDSSEEARAGGKRTACQCGRRPEEERRAVGGLQYKVFPAETAKTG